MRAFALVILCIVFMHQVCMTHAEKAKNDKTRQEEQKGEDVVRAVVTQIRDSKIFPNDNQFLRRIAYVESKYGNDRQTYRSGYYGGIWQVDRVGFEATQDTVSHPSLTDKHKSIIENFDMRWHNIKWKDLRKPFYSGLAARLFLSIKPGAIPSASDIEGQARYWKEHYNTPAGAGTVERFIEEVTALNDLASSSSCEVDIDLVFVMDSSGSIGGDNFETMKTFVYNFSGGLDIGRDENQVAVITYSHDAQLEFSLNQYTEENSLLSAISAIPYSGGGTNTAEALDAILLYGFTEANGARSQVLRIAIVMTDGRSCLSCVMEAAARVHATVPSILVYAVGIGDNINHDEIAAIASRPEFIVQLESFAPSEFRTFQEERTQEICFELSTPVNPGEKRDGDLPKGESTRLEFPFRENGLTVHLCVSKGRIVFYAARAGQPNEAFYDEKIVVEAGCYTALLRAGIGTKRKKGQADSEEKIFVTILGDAEGENCFELDSSASKPGEAVQIEPRDQPTVTEGDSITFSCVGSDPSSILVGRRTDDGDITNLPSFGDRLRVVAMSGRRIDYVLGPLSADDHTAYMYCSSGASISTEIQLTVYYCPRYQELPSPVLTVVHRQPANLSFKLSANPPPNFHWLKNGKTLEPTYRVNISVNSISFNPAYVGDFGSYIVTAYNSLGNSSLTFQLDVEYAPRFYEDHFSSFLCQKVGRLIECIAPEGGTGYLNCGAFGNPKATLALETRVTRTDNIDFDPDNGDALIRDVSVDNKGLYTCIARNSIQEVHRTYSLLVGDGTLPEVENFQVTVQRQQDDFIVATNWNYDTSTLALPPARFHLSLYTSATGRRTDLATWVTPRESRSYTLSIKELNLKPRIVYQVEIVAENALGRSEASTGTFSLPICPPMCSVGYCTANQTRRAICTMTSEMRKSNCSVLCPVTLCHACYFGTGELRDSSVLSCAYCPEGYLSNTLTQGTTCFKRWAQCIRRANFGLYGKTRRPQQREENFKCYEHPCL